MGGSGSGWDPVRPPTGGGGGSDGPRDCASVRFVTTLEQGPGEVPERPVGTRFEVLVLSSDGTLVVGVIDDDGVLVGTVVEEVTDMLRCLRSGVAFIAEVRALNLGLHRVEIRASDRVNVSRGVFDAPTGVTEGSVELAADDSLPVDLRVGDIVLGRRGICELRSLVRVGVPFRATPADGGVVVTAAG